MGHGSFAQCNGTSSPDTVALEWWTRRRKRCCCWSWLVLVEVEVFEVRGGEHPGRESRVVGGWLAALDGGRSLSNRIALETTRRGSEDPRV